MQNTMSAGLDYNLGADYIKNAINEGKKNDKRDCGCTFKYSSWI